ncbi:C-reactive protein-like [Scleropages formosus]|uniref:Pentraxin family member n=1 Tax=Scleropages formosus TaxID=113540 RepID=A0A0P7XFA1_SCLFO|nr:serum amyloid P-component-like [Scleropages formosus]KPP74216.1 C-reactive protein-like [Scleropages formosus]
MLKNILIPLSLGFYLSAQALEDLHGKVFTFPTLTDHVKVTPMSSSGLTSGTVCLRYYTDADREHSFFSLATKSHDNAFLLYKVARGNYELYVGNDKVAFQNLPDEMNRWNSVCGLWDSNTGLGQFWVNGRRGSPKLLFKGGNLQGPFSIILGQDQDSYGGDFSTSEALYGQLTDVHMWDHILPTCEIQRFMQGKAFKSGNIVDWGKMDFILGGKVVLQKNQEECNAS